MRITQDLGPDVPLETVPCDFCESDDYSDWAAARGNTLSICNGCGLIWTNPRISDRVYKDKTLYNSSYFLQSNRLTDIEKAARTSTYDLEYEKLNSLSSGGKILDVGCGMGWFLEGLAGNWDKHGCDLSSFGLFEAVKRGIMTYHGEFEKLPFDEHSFDVVYMRASLHHTFSPSSCLKKAHKILKKSGLLAITMCSNSAGPMGSLFRGHVKSYDQTINYLFSEKVLREFLARIGFRVIECTFPYFGTGYDSPFHYLEAAWKYPIYALAKMRGLENSKSYRDFSSPPFYGNYLNVYASVAR